MESVEELLEIVCSELESYGHPELIPEVRALLAKIEAMEPVEADEEFEADEEPE